MSTDNAINISPATAILFRLNAFQVRCDGVSSANFIDRSLAKYRLFGREWQRRINKRVSFRQTGWYFNSLKKYRTLCLFEKISPRTTI